MLVDEADINQTSLAQERDKKSVGQQLVHLVLVLARMLVRIPKVALNLGNHRTHCREKRSERHFVAVSRVDGLAGLREDKEVLSDLVKLFHAVLDVYFHGLWKDVFSLQKELNRTHRRHRFCFRHRLRFK